VAGVLIRAEAKLGLEIRDMSGPLLERIDIILMTAQRRKLSPSLYERIWRLRALAEKVLQRAAPRARRQYD
jgi:hypothetical protein